ncbi:hypothetical protein SEA_ACOLYTE_74 [Mycobacterium phage Acolyte]|nr:hypothetical protein SEA_ACOLYTE_74 [Mycobacterium phage Acolyte]
MTVREKRIPLSPQLASEIFKEKWGDTHLLGDIAGKLTCPEFEALADMLLAVGVDPDTVEEFEDLHAESDECGDMHCQCDDPECIEEREE